MQNSTKRDVQKKNLLFDCRSWSQQSAPRKPLGSAIPTSDLLNADERLAYARLQAGWDSYNDDDTSEKDSIYYDAVCRPPRKKKHYKAFIRLRLFFFFLSENDAAGVQSLPLRIDWIPCHTHPPLDSKILRDHVLPDDPIDQVDDKSNYCALMFASLCAIKDRLLRMKFLWFLFLRMAAYPFFFVPETT